MQLEVLSNDLAVAPQIHLQDIKTLYDLGYKSIICNRPDNEEALQPEFGHIEQHASEFQMHCVYLPVIPGQISEAHGLQFSAVLQQIPLPAVAYCRTGKRAVSLWQLASGEIRQSES